MRAAADCAVVASDNRLAAANDQPDTSATAEDDADRRGRLDEMRSMRYALSADMMLQLSALFANRCRDHSGGNLPHLRWRSHSRQRGQTAGPTRAQMGHPQAAAINAMSWIGIATGGLLWPVAFIWAFTTPIAKSAKDDGQSPGAAEADAALRLNAAANCPISSVVVTSMD